MSTTTLTLDPETTVGQLVAERPNRARVFETFGIDYCCGGKKPLSQACGEKGVSTDTVLSVLQLLDEQADGGSADRDWTKASLTELANNIELTHHAYLKQELPRLEFLTGKVANRHGDRLPQLVELRDLFAGFYAELVEHMEKEERVLFPLCRQMDHVKPGERLPAFHCGSVENPIAVMVREHDDAGDALRRMRELTDNYTPPPDACNTFRATYDALARLEHDMHRHVHKENSVLFPKAIEAEARLRA